MYRDSAFHLQVVYSGFAVKRGVNVGRWFMNVSEILVFHSLTSLKKNGYVGTIFLQPLPDPIAQNIVPLVLILLKVPVWSK